MARQNRPRFSPDGTVLGTLVHVTPNLDPVFVTAGYTQSAFPGFTQSGLFDVLIKQFLPPNNAPTLTATAATVAANEGTIAVNSGAFGDLDGDTVFLFASTGTVIKTGPASWSWSGPAVEGPAAQPVSITANDGRGGFTTVTFQLVIANLPPVLGSATGPSAPVAKGASVTIAAPVADPGILDPITCRFQWADGTADTVKPAATGACSAAHTYAAAGVYVVTIIASDDDGASASKAFTSVVVTGPNAGFLTGGGWIQTPSGNLRFRGTSHQWLVIAGARAQATRAQAPRAGQRSGQAERRVRLHLPALGSGRQDHRWRRARQVPDQDLEGRHSHHPPDADLRQRPQRP